MVIVVSIFVKFSFTKFNYKASLTTHVNPDCWFTLAGTCIYTNYIFLNSSAKSFNLKKIDIVATDLFMRNFAKKLNLYESRKEIFESVAYKNFIDAIKVYQHFKSILSAEQNDYYVNRLKSAYDGLDHKIVLKNYSGLAKVYNQILLSNFSLLNQFYKIKK